MAYPQQIELLAKAPCPRGVTGDPPRECRLTGLGPKAEALGIKFLADLSKLQTQGG
jgi:hypothetical protein